MTADELSELVDQHVAQLAEHFDSVRIFVTKHNLDQDGESETTTFSSGRGNFYAQLGHIHEWLSMQNQRQRNYATQLDSSDE